MNADQLPDSVWIQRLKQGDAESAQELWNRYYGRLVALARKKLADRPRRAADEEDIALSAFNSFFLGVEKQRFPQLEDRHDLWQLLVLLSTRKIADLARGELAQKRGGGKVRGDSAFSAAGGALPVDHQPSAELAVELAETLEELLAMLDDQRARRIALAKLEGLSNHEIAELLQCGLRTVERKLTLIRNLWRQHLPAWPHPSIND